MQHGADFKWSSQHFKHLCWGLWGTHKVNLFPVRLAGCRAPLQPLLLQTRKMGSPSKRQPVQHQGASSGDQHKKCQKYCSLPDEKLRTLTLSKCVAFRLYICTAFIHLPQIHTHQIHTHLPPYKCATILSKQKLYRQIKSYRNSQLKNKKCKQKGLAKSVALNIQNMSLVRGG